MKGRMSYGMHHVWFENRIANSLLPTLCSSMSEYLSAWSWPGVRRARERHLCRYLASNMEHRPEQGHSPHIVTPLRSITDSRTDLTSGAPDLTEEETLNTNRGQSYLPSSCRRDALATLTPRPKHSIGHLPFSLRPNGVHARWLAAAKNIQPETRTTQRPHGPTTGPAPGPRRCWPCLTSKAQTNPEAGPVSGKTTIASKPKFQFRPVVCSLRAPPAPLVRFLSGILPLERGAHLPITVRPAPGT
jgi:hypothetical protein